MKFLLTSAGIKNAGIHDALLDLLGTVDLDLEDDVPVGTDLGRRRAVVVAEEFGPLEEPALGDARLERGPIREVVRRVGLVWALRPGRPGTTQPEMWVALHERIDDRPLPDPTGAGDDDHQRRAQARLPAELLEKALTLL